MNVTIIGSGYVGLTTGVALALSGHRVRLLDVDADKITRLQRGEAPFYEPGLEEALSQARTHLRFTTDAPDALEHAEVVMLAVGTPPTRSGQADLTALFAALETIARHATSPAPLVTIKSTVPAGTGRRAMRALERHRPDLRWSVGSNPEFLRQGRALHDALHPERIVIGADDPDALELLERLYQPLIADGTPLIRTGLESAELAKYAANAMLATKISFINEIANLCESVGANIDDIVEVLASDPRIGPHFLHAGIGYGGSCFPKDTQALAHISRASGYAFKLLPAVIEVNTSQRYRVIEKLEMSLGTLHGKQIALLGLAFKAGTDDLREAPSLEIAFELLMRGAILRAHDPVAMPNARAWLDPSVTLCDQPEHALHGADAAVIITEWPQYRALDWTQTRHRMRQAIIVDGRNLLEADAMRALEFEYHDIGRTQAKARTTRHLVLT